MDVPDNFITELKYDEHNEPSVIGKGTSYFNIFKCGRNLLDQLEVTYQRAFMASPVRERLYITSTRGILLTADEKPYQFERRKLRNYKQ